MTKEEEQQKKLNRALSAVFGKTIEQVEKDNVTVKKLDAIAKPFAIELAKLSQDFKEITKKMALYSTAIDVILRPVNPPVRIDILNRLLLSELGAGSGKIKLIKKFMEDDKDE